MASKVSVSVSVPRIYEDIPDLVEQAVVTAIVGDRNIANSVLMSHLQGPVSGLNSMRLLANEGDYYYGATEVITTLDEGTAATAWEPWLADNVPGLLVVVATHSLPAGVRGAQDYHGHYALQETPIFSPDTFSRFEYLGATINVYKLTGGAGGPEAIHLTVPNPILARVEHYVTFTRSIHGQPATTRYEIYLETTPATIPALHEAVGAPPAPSPLSEEIYPLVPLRLDGQDYAEDGSGLAGSASIKYMLSKLHIEAEDLLEGIKGNPEQALIDDAYLGFGMSITSDEEWEIAGLAETFSLFNERNPDSLTTFQTHNTRQVVHFRVIQSGGLNSRLAYNYIISEILPGIRTYSRAEYDEGSTFTFCYLGDAGETLCDTTGSSNRFVFNRPIPKANLTDPDFYEKITVSGLTQEHTIAVPGFSPREVRFTGSEDGLTIPLFHTVLNRVPINLRNDLAFGSMKLFIYAIDIQKLHWYETSAFKVLLVVITIVLAVMTYGASLTANGATALSYAGLAILAELIVTMVVLNIAVQWLVQELGIIGAVLAVILSLWVGGGGIKSLTLSLNTTWFATFTAVVRISTTYISEQAKGVLEELEEFSEEYEERLQELKDAQDILNEGVDLDLLDIIEQRSLPNTTINESPQFFYDRTSTTVDLAAISTSLIDDYYAAQLMLPVVDSYLPTHNFNPGV